MSSGVFPPNIYGSQSLDTSSLTQLLEEVPIGAWIMNESGQIVSGNRRARQIWGGGRY